MRNAGSAITPVVVAQFDLSDPFQKFMVSDPESILQLLTLDHLPEATFVLTTAVPEEVHAVEAVIRAAIAQLPSSSQQYWNTHLFFSATSINVSARGGGSHRHTHTGTHAYRQPHACTLLRFHCLNQETSNAELNSVLSQWPHWRRKVVFQADTREALATSTITSPRLDGHFQFCNIVAWSNHSPVDPTAPYPASPAKVAAVVTNPCTTPLPNLKGMWALVTSGNITCSLEEAARRIVTHANATAVIFMAQRDQPLEQIGVLCVVRCVVCCVLCVVCCVLCVVCCVLCAVCCVLPFSSVCHSCGCESLTLSYNLLNHLPRTRCV